MNELLTIREVMGTLKISRATVNRHIRSGRLRTRRIGRLVRIHAEDLNRFVNGSPARRRISGGGRS